MVLRIKVKHMQKKMKLDPYLTKLIEIRKLNIRFDTIKFPDFCILNSQNFLEGFQFPHMVEAP